MRQEANVDGLTIVEALNRFDTAPHWTLRASVRRNWRWVVSMTIGAALLDPLPWWQRLIVGLTTGFAALELDRIDRGERT